MGDIEVPVLSVVDPGCQKNWEKVRQFTVPAQSLAVPVSATLPASPTDGQQFDYVDATNGLRWRFAYNASSASAYKWEFVGGAPLVGHSTAGTNITLSSSSYVYQTTSNSPTITLPFAGDYTVRYGHQVIVNAGAGGQLDMSLFQSSTQMTDPASLGGNVGADGSVSSEQVVTLSAAALSQRVAGNTTTASAFTTYNRFISATPRRIG